METSFVEILKIALALIPLASVIVNFTPNDTDNRALALFNKILNILALNFNVKGNLNK